MIRILKDANITVLAIALLMALWCCDTAHARDQFISNGKPIAVEWFMAKSANAPLTGAKLPLVIILHGSGGLDAQGGFFRDIAADLSKHGRHACVVHYFDQYNLTQADTAAMGKYFSPWIATVLNSVKYAEKKPFVDGNNISLLGHSLGAQLALTAASRDSRIASVIDLSGSFVLPTTAIKRMPPVLILHGSADRVVPISRERALVTVLKRCGGVYEERIYPRGDHAFNGVGFEEILTPIKNFLAKRQR